MQNALFKLPQYRRLWSGQICSSMAYQMLVVAVGWQVYELTHSPFMLGMIGLVQFLPQFLLTLVVGHVADQYNRRLIVVSCQSIEAMVALLLALGSLGHWLTVPMVFACALVLGAARSFEAPTQQALLPTLVPAELLPPALAMGSAARQTAIIVGPALGGLIYALGPHVVYGTSTLLLVTAASFIFRIQAPAQTVRREPPTLKTLFAGVHYIWNKKTVLGAISLDLFSVLLGGATALLPIFARDILHTGPWGLGLLRAAPAVGALLMAVYLARFPLRQHVGKTMFAAVAGFGVATIIFGLSHWLPLSLFALFLLGVTDEVSVVVRSSLVQLDTPNEMRGRVSAVNFIFIGASNQLGEFESGVTAALLGTVPAVVLGGIGTLVVVGVWIRLFPALYHREQLTG